MEELGNGSAAPQADTLSPHQVRANLIENVHTLALQHGVPKAAAIAGINVNTVKSWALRGKWRIPRILAPAPAPETHPTHLGRIQPAEILRNALQSNKSRSTLALSSYLAATSEVIDSAPNEAKVSLTRRAKDLGDLLGRLYPTAENPNAIINIAVVTGQRVIERAC